MLGKWLPWAGKIALTVGVFAYLLAHVDLADAWRQAKGMDVGLFAVAVVIMAAQVPIGAVRWHSVVRALDGALALPRTLAVYYIGCFFNLALPSSVGGDAARMWFGRRAGLTLSAAVNSVMLERVATVLGLILLVLAMQPVLMQRLDALPGAWIFPALGVLGIAGVAVLTQLDRLPQGLHGFRAVRGLVALARDARRTFLDPVVAGRTLAWAVVGHVNLALVVFFLALALHINAGLLDCLALVPPVILITTLPISISGWGVREGAMIAAFGFVGVPAPAALTLSVIWGAIIILTSLPGGLVWLLSAGRQPMVEPAGGSGVRFMAKAAQRPLSD